MSNKTITDIYADDSLLVLTGDEKVPIDDPNDSDATKGTTAAAIAALAGVPVSLGDNDISSSNATLSMTTPNAQAVGYIFIVSWHSGDGSNNFQFTDLGSITLNGVLMSTLAIKGEGQGYWQLRKTAVNTWVTDGMTEIWDSDGGNFTGKTWEKYIVGKINQTLIEEDTSVSVPTASGSIGKSANLSARNFPLEVTSVDWQDISITSENEVRWITTTASGSVTTTAWPTFIVCDSIGGSTANMDFYFEMSGRWTTGHPRKV